MYCKKNHFAFISLALGLIRQHNRALVVVWFNVKGVGFGFLGFVFGFFLRNIINSPPFEA